MNHNLLAALITGIIASAWAYISYRIGLARGRHERESEDTQYTDDAPYNVYSTVKIDPGYQAMLENKFGGHDDGETLTATGWLSRMQTELYGPAFETAGNVDEQHEISLSGGSAGNPFQRSDESAHERILREDADWALMAAWDSRIWSDELSQQIAHWSAELDDWTELSDWDGTPSQTALPDWAK
jgi:hypothetical protein